MASVQGIVRGDHGAPVGGAVVVVGGRQTVTNAQGQFQVPGVPPGRQVLVVTARGFVQRKVDIDLSSGEVEKVTLVLRSILLPPEPAKR
jgi:uncharacterized membrane protein